MERFLERYGLLAVLLGAATEGDGTVTLAGALAHIGYFPFLAARFILGARMPSMVFRGSQGVPFWRFAAFDVVGCAAWAVVLTGLGYVGSVGIGALFGEVRRSERHLLAVVGGGGGGRRDPDGRSALGATGYRPHTVVPATGLLPVERRRATVPRRPATSRIAVLRHSLSHGNAGEGGSEATDVLVTRWRW